MWIINGNELKKLLLAERDAIPRTVPGAVYEFGIPKINHFGNAIRGGIRKALKCLEMCKHLDMVEVVHGYWKELEDYNLDTIYQCSVCQEEFVTLEGTPADNMYNYCPNCGAKMDLVAEDEEEESWEDYCADRCYECSGYGDDYYTDENGEMVSACDDCPYNGSGDWDDE